MENRRQRKVFLRDALAVSERAEGAVAAYRVAGDKPELTGPPVPVGGGPRTCACTPAAS